MKNKKKILIVFGTRPEAIKMAPLVKAFYNSRDVFETSVCVTAQHREMLDQVLDFFNISPDYDLDLMKKNQNLYNLTSDIILKMKIVLEEFQPDFVFVHGDTTTTLGASIATFYSGAKLCHVEAGLRTHNKNSPYPEEINRQVTSRIADFHFAPTEESKKNLILENIQQDRIVVTGNTVIDALLNAINIVDDVNHAQIIKLKKLVDDNKKLILVTGHRRENHGKGITNICLALKEIALDENVQIIYPVHLNPHIQNPVNEMLSNLANVILCEPLSYEAFLWLMNKSKIIITDSGGIQEEAPSLGKPVLVMRENTERPEAVEAGTVILVGTDTKKIVSQTNLLLNDNTLYKKMSQLHNPYGDGYASQRIIEYLSKK